MFKKRRWSGEIFALASEVIASGDRDFNLQKSDDVLHLAESGDKSFCGWRVGFEPAAGVHNQVNDTLNGHRVNYVLTSEYQRADLQEKISHNEAVTEIITEKGNHFDPQVVTAFLNSVDGGGAVEHVDFLLAARPITQSFWTPAGAAHNAGCRRGGSTRLPWA